MCFKEEFSSLELFVSPTFLLSKGLKFQQELVIVQKNNMYIYILETMRMFRRRGLYTEKRKPET